MEQIPLNHEASAGDTNKQATSSLPPEVVQCLENARFLHLATCIGDQPHVSLMNYTYLPSSPYSAAPVIVMTTNPASKKANNLIANPKVSLLVHDSRRLSSSNTSPGPPAERQQSSLAALLLNLNSSAMSSISATINGTAALVAPDTAEESFYRERHLENNTFDESAVAGSGAGGGGFLAGQQLRRESLVDGGGNGSGVGGNLEQAQGRFVAGEEVRVVVVSIRDVRIADWKGTVRDWVLVPPDEPMVNGTGA